MPKSVKKELSINPEKVSNCLVSIECHPSREHPLNYGYIVLAGRIERVLVFDGYDPAAGTLHAAIDERASLAWDLIELLRATLDKQLVGWVQKQKWSKLDFEVNGDGAVYLCQQLARVVIQKSWIPDVKIKQVIRWYAGLLVERKEVFGAG
jgi:CRISP-associated protein Cas1